MARSSARRRGSAPRKGAPAGTASRQEAASRRLAGRAQQLRTDQRDLVRQKRQTASRERAEAAAVTPPEHGLGIRTTALLLRFVSCGLFALALGLTWRLTLAPRRLGVGSTALGALFLLAGFAVGGVLWYIRDARLRRRDPRLVSDERIIFSFVVFAAMPFCVLLVLLVVWIVALIVGAN